VEIIKDITDNGRQCSVWYRTGLEGSTGLGLLSLGLAAEELRINRGGKGYDAGKVSGMTERE
jgi:hypothetical protein